MIVVGDPYGLDGTLNIPPHFWLLFFGGGEFEIAAKIFS